MNWILLVAVSVCCLLEAQSTDVQIKAYHGKYKGKEISLEGKPVTAFLGVGYAQPPTGKRRWQRTTPLRKFGGVRKATKAKSLCPQLLDSGTYTGKENCLYLDIMVGGGITENKQKAVLVYFNSYNVYQSGISHTGALLSKREELVVVVVNSRLGSLGYLYEGSGTGTMGLWDNLEALRWINKNIEFFGGDKSKVTVMGVDSGAQISLLLAISPLSDGLFNQIISMSALSFGAVSLKNGDISKTMRQEAGCKDDQMISCDAGSLTVKELVRATAKLGSSLDFNSIKADEDLFPVFDMSRLKKFNLLMGLTSAEQLKLSSELLPEYLQHKRAKRDTQMSNDTVTSAALMALISDLCAANFDDEAAQSFCRSTTSKQFEVSADSEKEYSIADFQTILGGYSRCGNLHIAEVHTEAENSSTFFYYVDVKDDFRLASWTEKENIGSDTSIMIKLAFGYPFVGYGDKYELLNNELYEGELFSDTDPMNMFGGRIELRPQSQAIMRYFANFVKTGSPSKERRVSLMWPNYDDSGEILSFIGEETKTTMELPITDTCKFFNDVFYKSKMDALNMTMSPAEPEVEETSELEDGELESEAGCEFGEGCAVSPDEAMLAGNGTINDAAQQTLAGNSTCECACP